MCFLVMMKGMYFTGCLGGIQMSRLDEFALISRLASQLPQPARDVVVGIGDDAAVVQPGAGEEVLLTTDTMVEGIHFLPNTLSSIDVGYKCVAVSISDIASMGGIPKHVLLSLAIPDTYETEWLLQMYEGVRIACEQFGCDVIGGNVTRTIGPFIVTSTLTGVVPKGQAILRSGAKSGDVVFVTGDIGGSAAGLALLQNHPMVPADERGQLLEFHRRPVPQVHAGQILRECGASSCNDISDGLASELNEIASASSVRLRIDEVRLPVAPVTRNLARNLGKNPYEFAWYGGEDYQLVGTAVPRAFAKAIARCESMGLKLTQIGRVEFGDGVVVQHEDGAMELVLSRGYNHFP